MKKLSELVDLEHQVELSESQQTLSQFDAKELEERGVCLRKLCITTQRCGFYGRTVCKLETTKQLHDVPNNKVFSSIFSVGDIVSIFTDAITDNSGVITHINPTSVTVAFDQPPFAVLSFDNINNLSMVKVNSDVTYKRLKRALEYLLENRNGPSQYILYVCFEDAPLLAPSTEYFLTNKAIKPERNARNTNEFEIILCDPSLNAMQTQAVVETLSRRDISIIHGPPGTGKTSTIVECIIQCVRRSQKVLACAPSNVAVDNLLIRLAPHCRVVRLGHPARTAVELQKYSLDAQVNSSASFDIISEVRGDIEKALGLGCSKKHKVNWLEVKKLKNELHQRENIIVYEVLNACDVVLSTTTSSSFDGPLKALKRNHFDIVFIDECAQAIEPACWIPLLHSPKCVLAGDHLQLPPTIISKEAAKAGLSVTLMERLIELHGTSIVSQLTTQYRMNRHIMQWSSRFLYGSKLVAHESVSARLLCDMPGVEANTYTETPLLFIDTAGCAMTELEAPEEVSKSNVGEANLVSEYVSLLVRLGVSPSEIAVIAPYSLQVDLISQKLEALSISGVEVRTVDGFQGREKEAVVISFTRSNDRGEIGFLSEVRRTNVAITRAKRHLCVVGDSATISNQRFIKGLLEYIQVNGKFKSGFDFLQEDIVSSVAILPKQPKRNKSTSNQRKARQENSLSFVESKEKERVLEGKIRTFSADENSESFEFPIDLSSRERYLVHKMCEELGLCHSSEAGGAERQIIISKPINEEVASFIQNYTSVESASLSEKSPTISDNSIEAPIITQMKDNVCNELESPISSMLSNDVESDKSLIEQHSLVICEICDKYVPLINIVTHRAHCHRISNLDKKLESAINTAQNSVQKKKVRKSAKSRPKSQISSTGTNVKNARKELDLDDDFAVLEAAIRLKEVCNFKKCNESIKLISDYCPYCKLHYCIKHCLFEIHGCTNMARSDIRTSYKESCRTIPKKQRAELEKKYQNALEAKASQRKCKK